MSATKLIKEFELFLENKEREQQSTFADQVTKDYLSIVRQLIEVNMPMETTKGEGEQE